MKSTATANANIALVKYWGKRNDKLILPQNGSISMTCDGLNTITTVEFSDKYKSDVIVINDEELKKDEKKTLEHIDRIRKLAGIKDRARIVSKNNFPTAAGLASSASGFAALTFAATRAAGLQLNEKELTVLTRLGSGSAARSVCQGFVEWYEGTSLDGKDSYAESIVNKDHWAQFRMITTIVTESKKKVSSRAGMTQTVKTSPFYQGWLGSIDDDLKKVRDGIKRRDFSVVGLVSEQNCLKMHALMMSTKPPIIYWQPATVEIMNSVIQWRTEGLECYFTIDAGPNVKVMCLQKDEKEFTKKLLALEGVKKTISCKPGDGTKLINKHLF